MGKRRRGKNASSIPFPPIQQCILIFLFSARDLSERGRASDRRNRYEDRGGGGRKKARSHHFLPPRRRKKKKEFGTCGPPFSKHTRERKKSFLLPRIILLSLRCDGDGSAPSLSKCTLCTVSHWFAFDFHNYQAPEDTSQFPYSSPFYFHTEILPPF